MRRSVTCSAKGIIWKPEMLMAFMLAIVKQRRQTVSLRTTIGTMGWACQQRYRWHLEKNATQMVRMQPRSQRYRGSLQPGAR